MAVFAHRRNQDGSFDSICPRCFRTIANSQAEDNLAQTESRHTCDPVDLINPEIKKPHGKSLRKPCGEKHNPLLRWRVFKHAVRESQILSGRVGDGDPCVRSVKGPIRIREMNVLTMRLELAHEALVKHRSACLICANAPIEGYVMQS